MNINNLIATIRENIRFKSDLTIEGLSEILEMKFQNFNLEIKKIDIVDLDVSIVLTQAEILINQILEFINIRFGIRIDYAGYTEFKKKLAKGLIELIVMDITNKNNLDIVKMLVSMIIEYLFNEDPDNEKIDIMYIGNELNRYVLELYSDIENIQLLFKRFNTVIDRLFHMYNNFIVIPIKWYEINLPIIFSTKNNSEVDTFIKVYVIGG